MWVTDFHKGWQRAATVGLADKQSWSLTSEDSHQYVGFEDKNNKINQKKKSTRDREAMTLPVRTDDLGAQSVPLEDLKTSHVMHF